MGNFVVYNNQNNSIINTQKNDINNEIMRNDKLPKISNITNIPQKQSQELASTLWDIANGLRSNMDSSKFKNYILGTIFYRYLSESTESYMNDLLRDDGMTYYEALVNPELAEAVKNMSIEHLGYIIEPQNLYASLIGKIKEAKFSIEDLEKAIAALTASTIGQPSEAAFDKLFDDYNLQDKDLGKEVSDRTALISTVMLKINDISFNVDDAEMDVLGTAYMILIGLFASDAGKKGGEFFTPTCASVLLARLATVGLDEVRSVCDPCAGSGSLLLEVKDHLTTHKVNHFYGQEMNGSTFNLLRMNLLMHGIPYKQFTTFNDDTLKRDNFYEEGKANSFTIQVSNPPYSAHWEAAKSYESDPRFSAGGALAPKTKADLAFVEHMAYHMAEDGRVAVLLPHGVLFRGNTELTIRKYLIETLNCIDAIIGLPANMFHGTNIPVCVLVLKKKRNGNSDDILFINASKSFTPGKNMSKLSGEDIDRIVDAYNARQGADKFAHVATLDEVRENGYNCNIARYIDTFDEEMPIDINEQATKLRELDKRATEVDAKVNNFFRQLGLDAFEQREKGLLKQILSRQIRFKANDGGEFPEWKEFVISDVFKPIVDKNHPEEEVLTIIQGYGTMPRNDISRRISYNSDSVNTYKKVIKGDFIIHLRSFEGGLEVARQNGIVSPAYTILRAEQEIATPFFYAYFHTHLFINNKLSEAVEGIRDGKSINMDIFWKLSITIPSLAEQQKIADFLTTIDEQISIEKEKLEVMQAIKKGLLQQIFC
jgi:type I restriction enzyme M protein